jgi:peroxiredoxin
MDSARSGVAPAHHWAYAQGFAQAQPPCIESNWAALHAGTRIEGAEMALPSGVTAPDFALTTLDGKPARLSDLLLRGPAVLFFFKVSCPVCQYAAPFIQRLFEIYTASPVTILGISQDDAKDTQAFMRQYGMQFVVALDDLKSYRVSNDYKLSTVPTIYLVDRDGKIDLSIVGWSRKDMEELDMKLSMLDAAQ